VERKKTIMHYRDRTDIIREILEVANGAENITKTKLMYRAYLSYMQVKEYIALLAQRDLVSYDSVTQTYKTTEKGVRLLQFCNELEDMMMNTRLQPSSPQPRKRQSSV
jgi:predicted transcriptional regulator